MYTVSVELADGATMLITFKSKKVALDVKEQLTKAGFPVTAEMRKEI